jgi:hypothetical protein
MILCLLRGTDFMFKRYLNELRLHKVNEILSKFNCALLKNRLFNAICEILTLCAESRSQFNLKVLVFQPTAVICRSFAKQVSCFNHFHKRTQSVNATFPLGSFHSVMRCITHSQLLFTCSIIRAHWWRCVMQVSHVPTGPTSS